MSGTPGIDALERLRERTVREGTQRPPPRVLALDELLALETPPRDYILKPILREKETGMIHAWRGVGKTHMSLGVAYAVASGGAFLRWEAPRPRRVLYVDGEMPTSSMKERLAAIVAADPVRDDIDPSHLQLICADYQEQPLPSLSTVAGQECVEPLVEQADLVIVDSISTLSHGGKENEAESWEPLQQWALSLRRAGKSLLFVHHQGKGGAQRGTSKREDILDVVIGLKRPSDYKPSEGSRFEVHFEKARSFFGDDAEPFEAMLQVVDHVAHWTTRSLDPREAEMIELYRQGKSIGQVAKALGVSAATEWRIRNRLIERGCPGFVPKGGEVKQFRRRSEEASR
jgi:putative DNA primase/helicase